MGAHCQHEGCNQKDFLPFKCAACGKSLCLMHRSYITHECSAGNAKDMTSMDCPICGKSVRFDKSQDVNLVWDEHYLNSCSQQPALQKETVRCFKPECRTILGPSNTYTCGKCHQRVCLTHRIPEEHSCVGNVRLDFLNRVQKEMTVGNADRAKKETKKHDHPVSMFLPNPHGSKAKKEAQSKHSHPSSSLNCPFCGLAHETDATLIDHIMAFHPDEGTTNSTASVNTNTSAEGISSVFNFPSVLHTNTGTTHHNSSNSNSHHREVCPLCQARFSDAIQLVRHFESAHSEHAINQQHNPQEAQGKCTIS